MADRASEQDREAPGERANRELIELLNGLRVALPGVQVLFAFLLTVPFTQRFGSLDDGDKRVYFAAVLLTAAATGFLIAPSAHHRMRFRDGVKEQLLLVANVLTVIGLVLLAGAMAAVTYLITDQIYSASSAAIVAGVLASCFVLVWFVLPLFYSRVPTERAEQPEPAESS